MSNRRVVGNYVDYDEVVEGTPPRTSQQEKFKLKAAQLRVLQHAGLPKEQLHDIFEHDNIIGTDPTADVYLDIEGVSARHARIEVSDEIHFIEDLDSKNGVMLNGKTLKPTPRLYQILDGQTITIGKARAIYEILPNPVRVFFPDTGYDDTGTQPMIPSTIPVVPDTLSLSLALRRASTDHQAEDDPGYNNECASPTMPMEGINFGESEEDEPVSAKKVANTCAKQDTDNTIVSDSQPAPVDDDDVETDTGEDSPQVIRDSNRNSPLYSPTHPQKVDASAEIVVRSFDSIVMSDDDDIAVEDSNEESERCDSTKEYSPDIYGEDDSHIEILRRQSRASEREISLQQPSELVVEDRSGLETGDAYAPDAPNDAAVPENDSTLSGAGEKIMEDPPATCTDRKPPPNIDAENFTLPKERPKRRRLGTRGKLIDVASKDKEEEPVEKTNEFVDDNVLQDPFLETGKSGRRDPIARIQKPSSPETINEGLNDVDEENLTTAKQPRQTARSKARKSLKIVPNSDCLPMESIESPDELEYAAKEEPENIQTDRTLVVNRSTVSPSPGPSRQTKRKRRVTTSEEVFNEPVTPMTPPALSPPPPSSKQYGRKTPSKKKLELAESKSSTPKRRKKSNTPSCAPTEPETSSQQSIDGTRRALRTHSTDPEVTVPKVCFTGIPSDKIPKIVKGLGAIPVDHWQDCTHLVTDKVRRTVKFLCALSTGKHIVSVNWLEACRKEKKFVAVEPYTLQDPDSEKLWGFSLLETQNKVRQDLDHKIFDGIKIYATPATPPKQEIQQLVEAAGAEYLRRSPSQPDDNIVIMGCKEDGVECQKYIDQGFTVVTNEYILCGILKHEADVEPYRFKFEETKRPSNGGRKRR